MRRIQSLLAAGASVFLASACAAQSGLRLQIQTQDPADCDPFRAARYAVDCQVDSNWQVRTPGRLLNLCADNDLEVSLAQILNVRPDFYTAEQAVGEQDGTSCLNHDVLLILAQEGGEKNLDLTSTGVMPARLGAQEGDAGVSQQAIDLSPYPVRLSFNRPDYAPFCADLATYWPGLTCNQNINQGRNTIMVSCPGVPVGAVQQIANLFQLSFQTLEWRDDPGACTQPYAIDVELAALLDFPAERQIRVALTQPTLAILRGDMPPYISAVETADESPQISEALASTWQEETAPREPRPLDETEIKDAAETVESVDQTQIVPEDPEATSPQPSEERLEAQEAQEPAPATPSVIEVPTPATDVPAPVAATAESETLPEVETPPAAAESEPVESVTSPEVEETLEIPTQDANFNDPAFRAALAAYGDVPILLQFLGRVDQPLCDQLTDLGLNIQCDTSVSETSSNLMLRCDSLTLDQARAFGAFLGLDRPRLWDWRDRFETDVACALPSAFEVEVIRSRGLDPDALLKALTVNPEASSVSEEQAGAVVTNTGPQLNLERVGPDLFDMGRRGYKIEVNASNLDKHAELCGLFTYLGYEVTCGLTLTEKRTNFMQVCRDLPDGLAADMRHLLGLEKTALRVYDWRTRDPLAERGCKQGPAFILEVHVGS